MFVLAYPYNWDISGADASAQGVATYALGLVVLVASIGSVLGTDYIERANADASASAGSPARLTHLQHGSVWTARAASLQSGGPFDRGFQLLGGL